MPAPRPKDEEWNTSRGFAPSVELDNADTYGSAMKMNVLVRLVWPCLLLLSGCAAYNAPVVDQLSEGSISARSERLLLLQLPGDGPFPVRYVQRNECLYLAAGGGWWRHFEQQKSVSFVLHGRAHTWLGQAFPDHPNARRITLELRDRWPRWMRSWFNATLVVLASDDPQGCLARLAD